MGIRDVPAQLIAEVSKYHPSTLTDTNKHHPHELAIKRPHFITQ
jgi:hypothetical protein